LSTTPIVYLEKDESWLFDGETFTPCDLKAIKKYPVGASIPLSNVQVASFKLPSSLGATEREIQTEIKMHEEGGLDANIEYEISSLQHTLEYENSIIVEAFACSHDNLDGHFSELVKKTETIDWIIPSFISYASYYTREGAEEKTDLFYYLAEDESYAVLFHNGEYVAHRRTLSLGQIAKDVGIDTVRCKGLLSKYGLVEERYPEEERLFFDQLQFSFSKQIEKIVHTINHKRGLFGIESIDRVFVDFDTKPLEGMQTIFSAYGMEGIELNTFLNPKDENVAAKRFSTARYIYLSANNLLESPLNLSPYERLEPWYKRHSGRLLFVSAAALILAMIHPTYFYINAMILDEKIQVLKKDVREMDEKAQLLSAKLNRLKTEVKENKAKLNAVQSNNKVYQVTLNTLPVLMNTRYVRQKMMFDAVEILEQYKLSALSLDQNGTHSMNIHVIADYAKRASIARFMKKWMQTGYKEARTDEIYLDENIYESKIEVLR
jgi:hypothetical protein